MYSRSYYNDTESPSLPENYRGEAFAEAEAAVCEPEPECTECDAGAECPTDDASTCASARQTSLFGNIFGALGLDGIRLPKIGSEEILIIAAALFLLLSREGDRECGIMLLLLLLIN